MRDTGSLPSVDKTSPGQKSIVVKLVHKVIKGELNLTNELNTEQNSTFKTYIQVYKLALHT